MKIEKNTEDEFFYQNDVKVTETAIRVIKWFVLVFPVMMLLSVVGVFNCEIEDLVILALLACIVAIGPSVAYRFRPPIIVMKYVTTLALGAMIALMGTNVTIGIYMTYALAMVFSIFYYDEKFTLRIAIISYVLLVISVYFRSLSVSHVGFDSAFAWFVGYSMGFLIEAVVMGSICVTIARVSHNMLEKLADTTQKADLVEQCRRAEEEAERANRAKGEFLANMSHEIRTPINAVLGMDDMILQECEDEQILEYARDIQFAGKNLLSLINDILDLSKVESGKMEIIPVEYDFSSVLHDTVNMISMKAEDKNLAMKVKVEPQLPSHLFGDEIRIRQVILNILNNAVKYTNEGTISLIVEEKRREGENVFIDFSVEDTGIGIKEDDLAKLFEKFQRIEEERNRNVEGTGLGMNITARLLELMGSSLRVESVYGEGSKFSFTLKQKIVNASPIGEYEKRFQESQRAMEKETFLYAPEASILVVDDNEMNLKVAKGRLKRSGILPDTADSGELCLQMAAEKQYDIIFLDHMMPEMDGVETCHRLREKNLLPEGTALVALTANAIVGAKEEYIKEGFDDYLSKPIEPNELEAQLEKYLPEKIVSYKTAETGTGKNSGGGDSVKEKKEESKVEAAAESKETVEATPSEPASDEFTMGELQQLFAKCPQLHVLLGLKYCMGSKGFYLDMLKAFLDGDKRTAISEAFEKRDINNYRILSHEIKGTSLSIGAQLLSEHAKGLEMAAKEENWDYIQEKHSEVLEEYAALLDGIAETLTSGI